MTPKERRPYTRGVIPIIDGHLDLSLNAICFNRDLTLPIEELNRLETGMKDHPCRSHATITFPELRNGAVVACLGTVLARAKPSIRPSGGFARHDLDYANAEIASAVALGQAAYYDIYERSGWVRRIRTADDLRDHMKDVGEWLGESAPRSTREVPTSNAEATTDVAPPLGLILAMEGADPILSPEDLQVWWNVGLRAVGLSHYGESRYAVGTGSDGPLTDEGRALLTTMESYPFILDLTHLSDTSFWEAIDRYGGPMIASHNNCRALVSGGRQFDDKQIAAVFRAGGVIGVALDAWMLYSGWTRGSTSTDVLHLGAVADHIDHMADLAGSSTGIAIGSDLDGAFGNEQTPQDVKTIADLQKLADILSDRGYAESDIRGIFYRNWLHFLLRALPSLK